MAPVKQGLWGVYAFKPINQEKWENSIKKDIDKLVESNAHKYFPYTSLPGVAAVNEEGQDCRPRLWDPISKQFMLVDTCAQVTVWPKRDYQDATANKNLALQAVNGSRIPTFGNKVRQVKLGRKTYTKAFIVADIECPIIGWDFIKKQQIKPHMG